MSVLAVVPARGGSKGLPGKNLLEVAGRSLVARAVASGLGVPGVDQVVVTTDDAAIAVEGRRAGAAVVDRPAELAGDLVPSADVVAHCLDALGAVDADVVVLLQPTSPLRTSAHVAACLDLHAGRASGSVVSVVRPSHHPLKALRRTAEGLVVPHDEEAVESPRQLLPDLVQPNGAVYVIGVGAFRLAGRFVVAPALAFEMSGLASIDVDDADDLALVRAVVASGAAG